MILDAAGVEREREGEAEVRALISGTKIVSIIRVWTWEVWVRVRRMMKGFKIDARGAAA